MIWNDLESIWNQPCCIIKFINSQLFKNRQCIQYSMHIKFPITIANIYLSLIVIMVFCNILAFILTNYDYNFLLSNNNVLFLQFCVIPVIRRSKINFVPFLSTFYEDFSCNYLGRWIGLSIFKGLAMTSLRGVSMCII